MTWILRNAFLALVAFATLAIMVMMAMSVEARDLRPDATISLSGSRAGVR
jgi:hypothetical protein